MKWFDNTGLTIVIIGAINWLLVGIFRFEIFFSKYLHKPKFVYKFTAQSHLIREMQPT